MIIRSVCTICRICAHTHCLLRFLSRYSIVTLASAPFNVVHVNAAYLALTNLPSASVLGRPFREVVANPESWKALVEKSKAIGTDANKQQPANEFSLTQIHGQSLDAASIANKQSDNKVASDVELFITKVGSSPEKVSHYAVELHPPTLDSSANIADDNNAADDQDVTTASAEATTDFGRVVA